MTLEIRDPVSRVRQTFERSGDSGPHDGEVRVAANEIHGVRSCSDREAHLRCYVTPPARLQAFLEEAARAGQQGLFTPSGRPSGLRGARWAASFLKRYRDETVFCLRRCRSNSS